MCEKQLGRCFVLTALHRLPSHSSVFRFCFASLGVFSMTVFKGEIISQSVSTWLKILTIDFFTQYQKCNKYFSSFKRLVIFFSIYTKTADSVFRAL